MPDLAEQLRSREGRTAIREQLRQVNETGQPNLAMMLATLMISTAIGVLDEKDAAIEAANRHLTQENP